MTSQNNQQKPQQDEVTLKEVIITIRDWCHFLLTKWRVLLIAAIIGMIVGGVYSVCTKPSFTATATFVLEEENASPTLGMLSGFTALLGVSTPNTNLFSGDNILWLYTSDRMIGETLLARVKNKEGKTVSLISWFTKINPDLHQTLKGIYKSDKGFSGFPDTITQIPLLTRKQNKVLTIATNYIRTNNLIVEKEKKAPGIIVVTFMSSDELFALKFVNQIVSKVNDFYIKAKTKKELKQVTTLKDKVEEYNKTMNQSMYQAAQAVDAVPNPNPALQTLRVVPQREAIDVQLNSMIYTTTVQQLEAAKVALSKETPLIQIVDSPVLPLPVSQPGLLFSMIVGGFVFLFFTAIFIWGRRFFRLLLAED